jgi:hypothetical protein
MGVDLGFEPSSPSEMDTFLGVLMAHGKARLASARNAVQHLLLCRAANPSPKAKAHLAC